MNRCRLLVLLLLPALVACQTGAQRLPAAGAVQPTVAGVPPAVYANGEEARRAFTRENDSIRATLEDAAWLRFAGDPATVEAAHRAYFEYGYTTFAVELRSSEWTQPTNERFVLEDSTGGRMDGRPLSYCGSPELVDDRYFSTFALSFRHVISRDIAWIRLTRVADGAVVEWTFCAEPASR